jgi:hypothetical protein
MRPRKDGHAVPGVSANMGVYSLARERQLFHFQVEPTSLGPRESNGRRLMTTPGDDLIDNNYTHYPLK